MKNHFTNSQSAREFYTVVVVTWNHRGIWHYNKPKLGMWPKEVENHCITLKPRILLWDYAWPLIPSVFFSTCQQLQPRHLPFQPSHTPYLLRHFKPSRTLLLLPSRKSSNPIDPAHSVLGFALVNACASVTPLNIHMQLYSSAPHKVQGLQSSQISYFLLTSHIFGSPINPTPISAIMSCRDQMKFLPLGCWGMRAARFQRTSYLSWSHSPATPYPTWQFHCISGRTEKE